jgi:hypothetical protein
VAPCGPWPGYGPTVARGYRRLSKREYNNVVHDLLGDTTQPANQFDPESYASGYDNGDVLLSLSYVLFDQLHRAAHALATTAIANNLPALIGNCDLTQTPDACVKSFLTTFAPRAYRRPLTAAEGQALLLAYTTGSAPAAATPRGFTAGLQSMLEALLTSHPFLFREELGGTPTAGVVTLTDYEVASELSFLVTGSMPDDELFAAAQNGKLHTVSDYLREFKRLIALPAGKAALRAFANEWLNTTWLASGAKLVSSAKDPSIYPNWTPTLGASMAAELDQYFDQAFFAGTGSLRELFTSTQAFVDATLAPIYGAAPPMMGAGLQPLSLDGRLRAGILTRAGWLTANSEQDNTGPVLRGLIVRINLLCSPTPPHPPSVALPPVAEAVMQHETWRRVVEATDLSVPECRDCHMHIDPIGFGFEEFDGLGQYRTTENTQPIDDSGQLLGTDIDGPFKGATQLEAALLTSKQFLGCFATQVYRDAMGQRETPQAMATIANVQRCFSVDAPVTDAFAAIVMDPAFVLRTAN